MTIPLYIPKCNNRKLHVYVTVQKVYRERVSFNASQSMKLSNERTNLNLYFRICKCMSGSVIERNFMKQKSISNNLNGISDTFSSKFLLVNCNKALC